jgi:NADP-dependent 3-hydroxy acid dehydrogenase YdfG
MVNIKSIRASNQAFSLSPYSSNLTAVFVGATSGIGLGTLKAFTKATSSPKIYIIGRSKPAVSALLSELQASNPSASLEFIESEISLIKNVESVCEIIKGKEEKVDVLFMSPGYLSFDGRNGELIFSPMLFFTYFRPRHPFHSSP